MKEDKTKTEEGAALWRQARESESPVEETEAPDALWLAAYLDGQLAEDEAARLEAWLAGDPALLDELLALRAGLAAGAEDAPAALVARAQALRPEIRTAVADEPSRLALWLGGFWLRPALPVFATLALLLAGVAAFELGRYQAEQLDTAQSAETLESDVPVDLLMAGLI